MWKDLEIPQGNFGLVRYMGVTSEELKISFVEAPKCWNIHPPRLQFWAVSFCVFLRNASEALRNLWRATVYFSWHLWALEQSLSKPNSAKVYFKLVCTYERGIKEIAFMKMEIPGYYTKLGVLSRFFVCLVLLVNSVSENPALNRSRSSEQESLNVLGKTMLCYSQSSAGWACSVFSDTAVSCQKMR